jgi:hypothetical protein
MVPVSKLDKVLAWHNPGYSSVYWFSRDDALEVRASEHSGNFSRFAAGSDALAIDIDDGEAGLKTALAILDREGLAYEIWTSGGKGYHLILPHEFVYDRRLPFSHRTVVEQLGLTCDLSLYQHGRVISLPGRIHPQTGRRKTFCEAKDGTMINIPMFEPPPYMFNPPPTDKNFVMWLYQVTRLAEAEPAPGNRHTRLWSAAMTAAEIGLDQDLTQQLLIEVNNSWKVPKHESEVIRAVSQAYQRTSSLSE